MVKIYVDRVCVVHAHPQKIDSKTDKPPGTPIKCYFFKDYGRDMAIEKAYAMHYVIEKSRGEQS